MHMYPAYNFLQQISENRFQDDIKQTKFKQKSNNQVALFYRRFLYKKDTMKQEENTLKFIVIQKEENRRTFCRNYTSK